MPQYTRSNRDGSYSVLDESGKELYRVPAEQAASAPPEVRQRFRQTDPSYNPAQAPIPAEDEEIGPGPDFNPLDRSQSARVQPAQPRPALPAAQPPPPPVAEENRTRMFGGDEWFAPWTSSPAREGEGVFPYIGRQVMEDIVEPFSAASQAIVNPMFRFFFGGEAPRQAAAPAPPTPPPPPREYPQLERPSIESSMIAEGFNPTPPEMEFPDEGDLPPLPLIEEGMIPVDPTLELRAQMARDRETRMLELTEGRRTSLEEQLARQKKIPNWLRGIEVLGAGLEGYSTATSAPRAAQALARIPNEINKLETQLLDLGLSEEDIVAAREEAEMRPISAQHQVDVQRILANHQTAVAEASQLREAALRAYDARNERDYNLYSQRLQIALARAQQTYADIQQSLRISGALGGLPGAEAIEAQVSPAGERTQGLARQRLARTSLQGLVSTEIQLAGDANKAVTPMRRRLNEIFGRMGLPAPRVNSRMLQNPQAFAEYLIRSSNGRILEDPEVQRFDYFPGIAAEE